MSANWVVPSLGTDFTQDFEDSVIAYIFDQWEETNPAKGSTMRPDTELEPDRVFFKAGFPDYFPAYEVCCIQTITRPVEQFAKSKYVFVTGLDIALRMKRLARDAIETEPQLENMEEEIIRITTHYHDGDIPGIMDLSFTFPDSMQRIYDATDNYAKTDWRSVVRLDVLYVKENIT